MVKNVFISHASEDGDLAMALCVYLESQGQSCWIAPRDIPAGKSWGEHIVRALDECSTLVLLLTEHANRSRHVVREVERADAKGAHVVTLRLDGVMLNPTLEYFLSADHWLDCGSQQVRARFPLVLDSILGLQGRPPTSQDERAARPGAAEQPARLSDEELARSLDQSAPDDWGRVPSSGFGKYIRRLFADH